MTGLETILNQISGDAQKEADEQLSAARDKAEKVLAAAKKEAEKRVQDILKDGEKKAQDVRDRAESAAKLERRNATLNFKQQLIREAIDGTRASLESAPDREYFDVLLRLATRYAPDGSSEMYMNARDLRRLPEGFQAELKKAAPWADITLSKTPADLENGFLLSHGGIDVNCTFRAIFEGAESELRDAAGKLLFPGP